jgi:TRAP-type C4-dicarboxylate transport system substrate-binding protein
MKKKVYLFCSICLVLAFSGCKSKEGRPEVVLKLGHVLDIAHPVHKAMVYMADRVKEKSGGRMIVEIYPSEQLGNEKESIEALQLGYMAMTKTSTAPMEGFVPQMKIFGIPYLFRNS